MDLVRNAQRLNVPLNWHPNHPVRSLLAMRMLIATPDDKKPVLTHLLYKSYWVDNTYAPEKEFLLKVAKSVGVNLDESVFEDAKVKDQLSRNTNEAVERGAPGVPFFFIDGQHYWGQDRLHFVEKALGSKNPQQYRALIKPSHRKNLRKLTMYFDFSSPWSYIGSTQIDRIVKEAGPNVTLELVPILLGALFKEIGTPNVPMNAMSEQKRQYYSKDMQDWLQWWGSDDQPIPLRFNSHFPLRTVLPLRVCIVEPKTFHALYKAAWVDDENIADEAVLKTVLNQAGFNGEVLIKKADSQEVKDQLKKNNNRAIEAGVCGVPSFQVNDGPVIWGQDRFNTVLDLLDGWEPSAKNPKSNL